MRGPREKPIDRLMAAMDRCALTRGEAQFTLGHRTGRESVKPGLDQTPEGERLHAKMIVLFEENGRAEKAFRRLAQRLLRATPTKPAVKPVPRKRGKR